jgi:hypothetical protein
MFTMKRNEGEFNPFHQLVYEYYNHRNGTMVLGSRKVDEARHDGWIEGYREMFAEVFCSEVNKRRFERLTAWESIPIMVGTESRGALQLLDQIWSKHVEERPVKEKTDWDAFYSDVEALVQNYAWSEEIAGQERDRHRQAVLNGTEPPTEDDIAWLTEEQGKASDEARRLAAITMKAERAKATGV